MKTNSILWGHQPPSIQSIIWKHIRLLLFLFVIMSMATVHAQKIVGYTPSWLGSANDIDYDRLTHINYAFALPTASGGLQAIENPAKLQSLVSQGHAKGVKVLIAIGGWDLGDGGGNDGRFNTLAASASSRNNFVNNVLSVINQYNLDGADIDWEFPEPVNGAPDNNFTLLMGQLSTALHNQGKLLTAAVNGSAWAADGISSQVFGYVDFLNIMAYDGDAGAGHSPYSYAESALNYYKGRGLPAAKAVIGVPFYARPSWKGYNTLIAEGADPYSDYFNGDYYNGINTIKAKTALAKSQGGGIMIWTLDHDVQGQYALLKAIKDEMGTTGGSGVVTLFQHCDYGGYSASLNTGSYTLGQLQALGVANDDISSLQVQNGYQITMYQHDNFTGNVLVKTSNDNCLVNEEFNDDISSVIVAQASSGWSATIEAENWTIQSGTQTEACAEGGQNVGWIDTNDWMVWDINPPSSGAYTVEYRVASPNSGMIQLEKAGGSPVYGTRSVPNTGGWQNWTTISHSINLTAGQQQIAIKALTGGWNINWLKLTSSSGSRIALESQKSHINHPDLRIFPNPTSDYLEVQGSAGTGSYTIYDLNGKAVSNGHHSPQEDHKKIDVRQLKAGIYFISHSKSKKVLRFIKQ
ncbi:glycosyl hydrolase family 18 protein [Marinoscillum sp. 108]|uniref:glycosyl hydrolase family 18 protein n=1 Tax=Marinoscillum sp. 108 TaxID=2653151 RepID=UPI0012F366AC|nr:glycosyl hydrolase family 18 protein [Marinoscillum sp. 108]VXD11539.1 Glycoside hydrolase [Marinoscillum sp. 108]